MNNRTKSYKNLCFSALSQVITIALGLLLPRLYMVEYGSEVNGLLNSLRQFLVYLGLFEAGIGATAMQALYGPVARDDWDGINGVLSATNRYYRKAGSWYLASLVALSLVYPFITGSELPFWLIVGAVFFSGIGNVVNFWVQGKYSLLLQVDGKSYVLSNLSTVITVATDLLKVLLISMGCNIVAILAAAFAVQLTQAVYTVWYVRRWYPALSLAAEPDYRAIDQRNYILVHQISHMVFQNTDVLILTVVCGLKTVSVYSVYKLVTSYLESILAIPINSVNFVLGQTFQVDRKRFIRRIDLVESFYGAINAAAFSVALFLFTPFVRLYTAGVSDIQYVQPWLPELFVAASLLSAMRAPMGNVINYAGHFKQTAPRSVLESVINLTVSLVGVKLWGIYGVLLGTVAALLYRTNDIICYSNRKILHRGPWRTYAVHAVDLAALVGLRWLYPRLFGGMTGSVEGFLLAGAGATVLSLAVTLGAQALLMPHCRAAARGIWQRRGAGG